MSEKIVIYTPRKWAWKHLHSRKERFIVLVVHRRAGKTTAAINHLVRDAMSGENRRYAYIAPTYRQAKDVAYDILRKSLELVEGKKFNETELRADLANGSRITLYGADNPDGLRGRRFDGVVFDEYSQQPSNIFTEIVLPALADSGGYAVWIGTPKGRNAFWELWRDGARKENWHTVLLGASATGLIGKEELEMQRKNMSEDEYEQEWNCSFDAAIKGAYYADQVSGMRRDGRICPCPVDPSLPVHTVWDLGMRDHTSIGFFQKRGSQAIMVDFLMEEGQGLPYYRAELDRRGYNYGTHVAPHDIEVRELGSGISRKEVAAGLGICFETAPSLPVQDGIEAARSFLMRLWCDSERCAEFVDLLARYRKKWDDKRGAFSNRPFHDVASHAADMLRYAAISWERIGEPADMEAWYSNKDEATWL